MSKRRPRLHPHARWRPPHPSPRTSPPRGRRPPSRSSGSLRPRLQPRSEKNGDLERQRDRLRDYAHNNGWTVETTYTDVGSGRNEDRRGLTQLLDDIQDSDYGRVLLTYEDRLTRFGFSYLERLFDQHGVTITVIEDETDKTAQEELLDDLITLVASVSGTLYGMRSNKKQQVVNAVETEVNADD